MSEEIKNLNNPFVFPNPELSINESFNRTGMYGISLRDYFAAKAMSSAITTFNTEVGWETMESASKYIAKMAYVFADEMLKQREL